MNIERIAQLLLGGVFAVRVLDGSKPAWARLGYGLVAADSLQGAFAEGTPTLGDEGEPGAEVSRLTNGVIRPKPLTFKAYRVRTIQDRVAKVHEQMVAGTKDPKIYALAREVLTRRNGNGDWAVREKDHAGEATALFNEVRKRVRYTWDPTDYDAFQTAIRTLELRSADCDDYATLLGALLRSVGHQVRSRIVQTKGSTSWNHIYLTVKVGNEWKVLDPSVDKPAFWEVPDAMVLKKQDFDVVEG